MNNPRNIKILFIFLSITKCFLLDNKEKKSYETKKELKYISIPFKENNPYYRQYPKKYTSYNFINDFFINNLSIDLTLGTPSQEVNSFLNQESSCFKFIDKDKYNKTTNWINNNYYYKLKTFSPKKSMTFLLNKNDKAIAEDLFLFKNENSQNITNGILIPFNIDFSSGEMEYVNELGLNSQLLIDNKDCPNFLKELKKNKLIKEEMYSLIYKYEAKGTLFIGDILYKIDEDKYNKNNFFNINAIQSKNGIKWNINFDRIYIYDKYMAGNNTLSYKKNGGKIDLPNNKMVHLKIDQKITVGTTEYKKMIDDLYFNNLINLDICKRELVDYNSKKYYVYSCTALKFATFESLYEDFTEPIYHYEHFPCLRFYSNNLNYTFELKHENLFQLKGDRYYFMIVFESEPINNNNQEWIIGEHFIKKHIFLFNVKTKKLWFYNEKTFNLNFKENEEDEDDDDNNNDNDNELKGKENMVMKKDKNIIIFILIILVIFFLILSFYLGIKLKERRKKKANELIDEYEYVSEKETRNKSINSINKNNDLSKNNNNYEIEMNIKNLENHK